MSHRRLSYRADRWSINLLQQKNYLQWFEYSEIRGLDAGDVLKQTGMQQ